MPKPPTTTPQPTCKGCESYGKSWCKLYASIIHDHNPVTICHKRKGVK